MKLDPFGLVTEDDLRDAFVREVEAADARYGVFTSTHEGLGVLLEEFEELKAAIRINRLEQVREEAIQVAAVAYRIAAATFYPDFRKRSVP